jgi:hypothetical protein
MILNVYTWTLEMSGNDVIERQVGNTMLRGKDI